MKTAEIIGLVKGILAVALLAIIPLANAQTTVFRCVIDGTTTYQQVPCPDEGENEEQLTVSSGYVSDEDRAKAEARLRDLQDAEEERRRLAREKAQERSQASREQVREMSLIANNQVAVGMSSSALVKSWGQPTKINRNSHGSDQWIYDNGKAGRSYVYVEDGKVTSWQQR